DFISRLGGEPARELSLSRAPIQTLHLISEDYPAYRQTVGHRHFKWIALDLTRDRTEQAKANFPVVRPGRDDHGRSAASLLVARLRVQADPDDVAALGHVGHLRPTRTLDQQACRSPPRHAGSASSPCQRAFAAPIAAEPLRIATCPSQARSRLPWPASSPRPPRMASEFLSPDY